MLKRLTDWWTRPTWDEYLTEQAECLAVLAELDDLRDDHKFICGEHDRIAGLLTFAQQEAERLRGLLMDQVERTPVHSIDIRGGAVDVAMSPPHWACLAMAKSFYDTLADAPNWNAMEVGPLVHKGVRLVVTVRRMDGESPEETVGKLRDMIERLLEPIAEGVEGYSFGPYYHDKFEPLIARARALINPMKKDA